jgi:signal peptidase II
MTVMALTARRSSAARRTAVARAAAVVAVVTGLDQLTKHTIADGIRPGRVVHIAPGLTFVHVRNPGVAFGFLSGGGAAVYVLTFLALAAIAGYLLARPQRPWLWVPSGMLIGGAISNLIDRVATGAVTDFVKLPHWPAFNLADMSITFGVIALLIVVEVGRGGRR